MMATKLARNSDMTQSERSAHYIEFLEEILSLCRLKEDYYQRVINNYGSHRADLYLKKIKELEEEIKRRMTEMADYKNS